MEIKNINRKNLKNEIEKLKNKRLITITAIENTNSFTLIYHFHDKGKEIISLKLEINKDEEPDSIVSWFPSANIYEREIHDLFGIHFKDNPFLDHNLFLDDLWQEPPPLRKKAQT